MREMFNQMGLIEAWGNGLKSIQKGAKEYGLPALEFVEMPETFRVNLFRNISLTTDCQSIGGMSAEHRQSIGEASAEYRRSIGGISVEYR